MLYVFVDETYFKPNEDRWIGVAAIAVGQADWSAQYQRLALQYGTRASRQRELVIKLLNKLHGHTVLGAAPCHRASFASLRVKDRFNDIGGIARSDTVWSAAVTYSVAFALKALIRSGEDVGTIDIYRDPKSLRTPHRQALAKEIRTLIGERARSYAARLHPERKWKPKVRRMAEVPKGSRGKAPSKLQAGVHLAHLATKLFDYGGHLGNRVERQNLAKTIWEPLLDGTVRIEVEARAHKTRKPQT